MSRRPTLDPAARRALLAGAGAAGGELPSPPTKAFSAPRFEEIEEYLVIQAQREFARATGIENPFYRMWL